MRQHCVKQGYLIEGASRPRVEMGHTVVNSIRLTAGASDASVDQGAARGVITRGLANCNSVSIDVQLL